MTEVIEKKQEDQEYVMACWISPTDYLKSFGEKQTTKTTFKVFKQCFQQEVQISCVWTILSDDIEANDSFG